ncbi:MAG: GNAT family N-acetyltransferase [Sporichthyaceae bacterium]
MTAVVRAATVADAAACAAVYRPYVTDGVVSLELQPPDEAQMAARIETALRSHAWLVAELDGRVVGYAYASRFNERAAYAWACAVSVYLEPGLRRTGTGRALYGALFQRLAERGYRTLLAIVGVPNEASVGLHRALGFEQVALLPRVGWKHGAWRDVAWFQLTLGDETAPAALR